MDIIGLEHISKVVRLVIDDYRQIVRNPASAPLGRMLWDWRSPNCQNYDWEEPDGSLRTKQTAGLSWVLAGFVRRDPETPSLGYELRINRPEQNRRIFGRQVYSVHFTPDWVAKVEHFNAIYQRELVTPLKADMRRLEGSGFSLIEAEVKRRRLEAEAFRRRLHKHARTSRHFRKLGSMHIVIPTPSWGLAKKGALRDSKVRLEAELTLMLLKWKMEVDQKAYDRLAQFVASKSRGRVDSSEVLARLLKSSYSLPQTTHAFVSYIRQIARSIASEEVRCSIDDLEFLTVPQTAQLLKDWADRKGVSRGFSQRTLYTAIERGQITAKKTGRAGAWQISRHDALQWGEKGLENAKLKLTVDKLAQARNIKKNSAYRNVRRQMKRGESLDQILSSVRQL